MKSTTQKLFSIDNIVTHLATYKKQTITVSDSESIFRLSSNALASSYNCEQPIRSIAHSSDSALWIGMDSTLSLFDYRANKMTQFGQFAAEEVYRIQPVRDNELLVACSRAENVISLLDVRNPYKPLMNYTCHGAFVTKFFPLQNFFYSADEDGNVYKLGYDSNQILNRVKFNQNQLLIDLDYSYNKDYFLVLLENNILKQTETLVFDNIENESTPYHQLIFCQNSQKTVFSNNAEVVFCDEICDEIEEYVKETDYDCQIRAFDTGVVFSDGGTILFNRME
ncbi:Conserved_hypothetical protein [Hexamita inflata]|uniref:Uncharacterized protein n=1 Tax=Hexamita inflata TaxID=28002 RepID=A0AA86UYU1_9EUKA|nr:Conserved hypothetical protein [Hexamita inflata]